MNLRHRSARIVGAATAVTTLALGLGAVSAQAKVPKSYDLATLKAVGDRAAYHRLVVLFELTAMTTSARTLPAVQRDALLVILHRDADGIAKFRARLAAETDPAAARADVIAIHDRYLVGRLVDPQVRLTIRASRLSATADRYQLLANAIDMVLADRADDTDISGAQPALADMQKTIASAEGLLGPLPAQLLALDPSGYPGNGSVLSAARTAEDEAQTDLNHSINAATRALKAVG